jgi:hypothetical protein
MGIRCFMTKCTVIDSDMWIFRKLLNPVLMADSTCFKACFFLKRLIAHSKQKAADHHKYS